MGERPENDGHRRLGRHWQTIQRSLFPEWEREMYLKFIEDGTRHREEAEVARKAKAVST